MLDFSINHALAFVSRRQNQTPAPSAAGAPGRPAAAAAPSWAPLGRAAEPVPESGGAGPLRRRGGPGRGGQPSQTPMG